MKFRFALAGAAVFGFLTAGAGAAMAQKTYTYGQWLPPKHNVNRHGIGPMVEELTKAGIPWKLVAGGQLFSAKATLKSVGNGTAEAVCTTPSIWGSACAGDVARETENKGATKTAISPNLRIGASQS